MYLKGKVFPLLLGVLMSLVIVAAFLYAEPEATLGDAGRVIFFHVPTAWVAVLSFFVSMVSSILYLKRGKASDDHSAVAAAELGLTFTVIATISGAIFANLAWGTPWNWDPRQTTIFVLMLIYLAYFALRSAVDEQDRRARLSAVYAIFAFITVPFLVFILPRVYWSLHPDLLISTGGQASMSMTPHMLQVFMTSLLAFTGLFVWVYRLQVRIAALRDQPDK